MAGDFCGGSSDVLLLDVIGDSCMEFSLVHHAHIGQLLDPYFVNSSLLNHCAECVIVRLTPF